MKDQIINIGKQFLASLGLRNAAFYGVNVGAVAAGAVGNWIDGFFGLAPILLIGLGLFNIFFRKQVD